MDILGKTEITKACSLAEFPFARCLYQGRARPEAAHVRNKVLGSHTVEEGSSKDLKLRTEEKTLPTLLPYIGEVKM